MKCPICPDTTLLPITRHVVGIGHCPQCEGVWLNPGELEQLIEHPASLPSNPARSRAAPFRPDVTGADHRDAQGPRVLRKKFRRSDVLE